MNADDERFVHHDEGRQGWINSHENFPHGTRVRVAEWAYAYAGQYGTVEARPGFSVRVVLDSGDIFSNHASELLRDSPLPSVVWRMSRAAHGGPQ